MEKEFLRVSHLVVTCISPMLNLKNEETTFHVIVVLEKGDIPRQTPGAIVSDCFAGLSPV